MKEAPLSLIGIITLNYALSLGAADSLLSLNKALDILKTSMSSKTNWITKQNKHCHLTFVKRLKKTLKDLLDYLGPKGNLVIQYRAQYGCATKNGEQLSRNNNQELWAAVERYEAFGESDCILLQQLSKLFAEYWEKIEEIRQQMKATGKQLQLTSGC